MARDTLLGFPAHTLPYRRGKFITLSTASRKQPARVRIKKTDIQGNTAKWMSDFIEEITKEIYSGEKRA